MDQETYRPQDPTIDFFELLKSMNRFTATENEALRGSVIEELMNNPLVKTLFKLAPEGAMGIPTIKTFQNNINKE